MQMNKVKKSNQKLGSFIVRNYTFLFLKEFFFFFWLEFDLTCMDCLQQTFFWVGKERTYDIMM